MIKKLGLSLWIVVMLCGSVQAQVLQASVNRTEIPEGETFLLTLEYEGKQLNETPNLTPLEQDFNVYSVSNSYRTNIINGDMKQSMQWNMVLMPKDMGDITIPSLTLGTMTSNPVKIKVGKVSQTAATESNQPRFSIKGEVDTPNPYVQQQVNYTLSIYDTGGLQGGEPLFNSSGQNDWIIKNLGDPSVANKVIDGRNLREIKFHYALFPQRSGQLVVPEVQFNGFYLSKNPRRSDPFAGMFGDDMMIAGFGMADIFASRTPVMLTAKPININVKAIPAENAGNWWLPAEEVRLFSQWEPERPQFHVGEAVNRTIYLKAEGVIDSQLPDIKFPSVANLKQYPEKPEVKMQVENGKIMAVKKISTVYIPGVTGKITIPSLSVDWFNVGTNTKEVAMLPEMVIEVLPALNQSIAVDEANTEAMNMNPLHQEASVEKNEPKVMVENQVDMTRLYILLLGAFVLGIGISYIFIHPRKGNKKQGKIGNDKKSIIQQAKEKDLRALRDSILGWAAEKFHKEKINNFQEVEALVKDEDFKKELEKLSACLYADNKSGWDEKPFLEAFARVDKQKSRKKKDEHLLPELYR